MNPQRRISQILVSCLLMMLAEATYATAKEPHEKTFIVDRYWSPHAASSIILSSRTLANEAEDSLFRTDHTHYSVGGQITSTVLNYVLNTFLTVANHEIFGHGFRTRSLGIPVSRYSIKYLGLRGGTTSYKPDRPLSADEQLLITIGGSEANSILARQLLFKNFHTWPSANAIPILRRA